MFRAMLQQMVEAIPGGRGAIFLDHEGEAVERYGEEMTDYQLQVIGAYQGIFLSQLRRLCEDLRHGLPSRFRIGCRDANLYILDLKDGYYLVAVTSPESNEGIAWQQVMKTSERLLEEIG